MIGSKLHLHCHLEVTFEAANIRKWRIVVVSSKNPRSILTLNYKELSQHLPAQSVSQAQKIKKHHIFAFSHFSLSYT